MRSDISGRSTVLPVEWNRPGRPLTIILMGVNLWQASDTANKQARLLWNILIISRRHLTCRLVPTYHPPRATSLLPASVPLLHTAWLVSTSHLRFRPISDIAHNQTDSEVRLFLARVVHDILSGARILNGSSVKNIEQESNDRMLVVCAGDDADRGVRHFTQMPEALVARQEVMYLRYFLMCKQDSNVMTTCEGRAGLTMNSLKELFQRTSERACRLYVHNFWLAQLPLDTIIRTLNRIIQPDKTGEVSARAQIIIAPSSTNY